MASVWLDGRVAWLFKMPGIHDAVSLKPNVELVKVPGTYEVSPLPKSALPRMDEWADAGIAASLALMLRQQQVIEVRWHGL